MGGFNGIPYSSEYTQKALNTGYQVLNTSNLGNTLQVGSGLGTASNAFSNNAFRTFGDYSKYFNATDAASKAGEATSGLDWFGNSGVIGSIGTGINAIGNIWNAYNSFTQGKEQLKLMREANDLAREQFNEEKARYNKREAEHDAATAAQQNTTGAIYSQFASNYEVPQKKKSVVERE